MLKLNKVRWVKVFISSLSSSNYAYNTFHHGEKLSLAVKKKKKTVDVHLGTGAPFLCFGFTAQYSYHILI